MLVFWLIMTVFIIAQLTIRETQRRRILWVALLMGIGFLAVFGVGFNEIYADMVSSGVASEGLGMFANLLLTAGLYVINFLIIMMAVLTSVTAVPGEIDSHTIETLVTKPIRRGELVLGKWMGYAFLLLVYVVVLTGSTMLIVYWRSGFVANNIYAGMGLMVLEGLIILSLTIAGGTRLSTLANGVLAFMMYGIAFLGGWVEQIGAILRNETAVDIGIATSLIMPSEVLWRKALTLFQPGFVNNPLSAGPFAVASQPNDLMVTYAVAYAIAMLLVALWSFSRRDL
jgi:ABC-type transport system involved in multi-copper enzyme maturation permease subunit